ncbi:alpha/beta hydrolase [Rhodococcus sp. D2-41]|nr:alpha/beta hydrolase [Rhodococcus sp. D2-41]
MSDLITERRAEYAGFGTRELVLAGDGAPLVLLHGYSHTADVWRPVLSRLAAAGHAAVAVDVPGFGAADRLADGPVMPQMDKFVRGVVEHWAGSGQVTLVGNSMGGALTVRAACTPDLPIAAAMPIDLAGFGLRRSLTRLIGLPDRLVPLLRFPLPRPVFDRIVYQAAKRATYAHGSTADPAMAVGQRVHPRPRRRAARARVGARGGARVRARLPRGPEPVRGALPHDDRARHQGPTGAGRGQPAPARTGPRQHPGGAARSGALPAVGRAGRGHPPGAESASLTIDRQGS